MLQHPAAAKLSSSSSSSSPPAPKAAHHLLAVRHRHAAAAAARPRGRVARRPHFRLLRLGEGVVKPLVHHLPAARGDHQRVHPPRRHRPRHLLLHPQRHHHHHGEMLVLQQVGRAASQAARGAQLGGRSRVVGQRGEAGSVQGGSVEGSRDWRGGAGRLQAPEVAAVPHQRSTPKLARRAWRPQRPIPRPGTRARGGGGSRHPRWAAPDAGCRDGGSHIVCLRGHPWRPAWWPDSGLGSW